MNGVWTGNLEDKQNKNVFYVSYGTSTNPKKDPVTKEQDMPAPLDLLCSFFSQSFCFCYHNGNAISHENSNTS